MTDLQQARQLLETGEYTCVLCKGESVHTSTLRGIAPMVEFLKSGLDLDGYSVADKVVGKAPALLFVLAGAKEVYAPVMTYSAKSILTAHGIDASCDQLADQIQNRTGTGPCPMEQTVEKIDSPQEAFEAVQQTLARLRTGK